MNYIITTETDPTIIRPLRTPQPIEWGQYLSRMTGLPPYEAAQRVQPTAMAWSTYMCILTGKPLPPVRIPTIRAMRSVYINHSRYVVDCPYCKGYSAIASKSAPLFWCPTCLMVAGGGDPITTVFPANTAEIEAVLLKRPDSTTRNWFPGETVDDLRRENIAYEIEV